MSEVWVCQFRSCSRDGAEMVSAALQESAPPHIQVVPTGCLGLCGSGPIVVVTEDDCFYWRMTPAKSHRMAQEHLVGRSPVTEYLHPRLHPPGP
ncbi:MAG: (2Fe-2S) ferredoxin domain-containing protein [Oscillatoriales cyanobacterium SM2_2_1]|nr:(2Fe-2S) ferredoxin domain-containing protein [Oscillatoriales cyanobacterium SM2_2_1]